MGGVVALDLALRAPGLFRGVLLCDSPLLPQVDLARARTAAALGMRVAYLARTDGAIPTLHAGTRAAELSALAERWLGALGLDRNARLFVEDGTWPSDAARAETLQAALEGISAGR
jgi:pimeloyl-ACP methyl ester carboxylesterase